MSDHDLSTLLRDHLDGEPPVTVSSADAIRSARRTSRLAGAGAAAAVLAVAVAVTPALVGGGDGPDRGVEVATPAGVAVPDALEAVAADELTPYVGALGAPTWDVQDVDGTTVEPAAAGAQYFELTYATAGGPLQLHVGGFAPSEWELYDFDGTCAAALARDFAVSCEQEVLADGTLLITSVAPYTNVTGTTKRMITVAEARAEPDGVLWARSASTSTRDGVTAGVSEFVAAASPETAGWRVPPATLRAVAEDADLLDPAAVAHAEVPAVTDE